MYHGRSPLFGSGEMLENWRSYAYRIGMKMLQGGMVRWWDGINSSSEMRNLSSTAISSQRAFYA